MYFSLSPGIDAVSDPLDRRVWGGMGRLAGDPPQGEQDGRAKIMNVPAHVEITILEPITYWVVARTVSKSDGTWEVRYLDPAQRFTVIGADWGMGTNSAIQDWVQPAPLEP